MLEPVSPDSSLYKQYLPPSQLTSLDDIAKSLQEKLKRPDDMNPDTIFFSITVLDFVRKNYPEIEGSERHFEELNNLLKKNDIESFNNALTGYIEEFKAKPVYITTQGVFREIARGKVKSVLLALGQKKVYYIPQGGKGIFGRIKTALNTAEMRREKEIVDDVKRNLSNKPNLENNLVLDITESTEKIAGKYTVTTDEARDFEKYVRQKPNFPQSAKLGLDFLKGLEGLHTAGYVHGDLKPENALVFDAPDGQKQVKIADFGKARKMDDKKHGTYVGNPRFCSPEGFLSQKGEVFSAALVLIRCLEEELLDEKGMLVPPEKYKDQSSEAEKRRGIEKYLIENADCVQTEATHMRGKFRRFLGMLQSFVSQTPQEKIKNTANSVHIYISHLRQALEKRYPNFKNFGKIEKLLLDMTKADPDQRLTASEAAKELERLLQQA